MDARDWQRKGAAALRAGDLAAATAALISAARLDPDEPEYLRNLAELAKERGASAEALAWTVKAAEVTLARPTAEKLNYLAAAWADLGARQQQLDAAAAAFELSDNPTSRAMICDALRGLAQIKPEQQWLLVRAINEGWLGVELHRPASAILHKNWPKSLPELAQDTILGALMSAGPLTDPIFEVRLTAVRRLLLFSAPDPGLAVLQARLAAQCFMNEYAWSVGPEEEAEVARMMAGKRSTHNLLKIASYVSIGDLPDAEDIHRQSWPQPLADLVQQQVSEPLLEFEIAETIPALTPISDEFSKAVRDLYEQNPYPRWTRAAPPRPQSLASVLQSQFPRARLDPIPNADAPEILIAGCGTGSHALHVAGRYAGAKVLAIDLSLRSLAFAKRKSTELGIGNIDYAQADLLEIGSQFDLIDASGTLHHLAEPEKGLRKLSSVLRPGGVMRLGFYSRLGRAFLKPARELARQYPHDKSGLRAFRQAIYRAPEGDPVRSVLGAGDFYSLSNCRDLLFHVMEHESDLHDIGLMMDAAGLRVIGFVVPSETLARYRQMFPADPAAADLNCWQTFERENPNTFRAMYQFWVQKPAL